MNNLSAIKLVLTFLEINLAIGDKNFKMFILIDRAILNKIYYKKCIPQTSDLLKTPVGSSQSFLKF